LTFNYTQLKIVVLSGGGKKWCFDRLESDMMIFCEWLVEGVKSSCDGLFLLKRSSASQKQLSLLFLSINQRIWRKRVLRVPFE